MAELNAALKKERLEKASLQQTLQQAEATSEESEEKSRLIEKLKQELLALQDDNRRVLSKAFSNDDASDLARAKQEIAIRDAEGGLYLILRIGDDTDSAANPRIARLMAHEVTVDGELLERDGVRYLLVDKIADDKGVINLTHDEHGIQPFGN